MLSPRKGFGQGKHLWGAPWPSGHRTVIIGVPQSNLGFST